MLLTALLCFECFVIQQLGWRQQEGSGFALPPAKSVGWRREALKAGAW